jgi:hypothetical protein
MNPVTTRTRSLGFIAAAVGLWFGGVTPSHAATVTPNPADHQSGLTYEWEVQMGDNDSATYAGSVGAKSWAEPVNPDGRKGWTHTTDWTLLDLTSATGPTHVTLTLGRGATGSLFPAFTMYSGVEDLVSDFNSHTFTNDGNTTWQVNAEDPPIYEPANITYISHLANAGGPTGREDNGTGVTSVSGSWVLAPGLYSLVYGGNPAFSLGQGNVNYAFSATLTTAPVPVPAALYLFGSGLIGLAGLARRRRSA